VRPGEGEEGVASDSGKDLAVKGRGDEVVDCRSEIGKVDISLERSQAGDVVPD
jgi:hypothetical protein